MERQNELMIRKKVFVILKSGRIYNGTIKYIKGDLITLIDKFDEPVLFSKSEISSMEVGK